MFKKLSLVFALFFFCAISSQAQFKHLLHKAEKKVEQAISKKDSSKAQKKITPAETSKTKKQKQNDEPETPPAAKAIDFPHTGHTVNAMTATMAPVLDEDIQKMASTPKGQYVIKLAREKGYKGGDADIFKQLMLMNPQNLSKEQKEKLKAISEAANKKFPPAKSDTTADHSFEGSFNPTWGGVSLPSFFYYAMVGSFDITMTNRFIKTSITNDHPTMAMAFGVNAASITDLDKRKAFALGSVLGIQFAKVHSLDSLGIINHKVYGALSLYPVVKETYLGVKGVKVAPGKSGMMGKYHTTSEKLILPVQPYRNKNGTKSKGLLYLHDVLSGKDDLAANNGQGNWDPSYKLVFQFYFSHDFDKYLPIGVRNFTSSAYLAKGYCVGFRITDENNNSVDYRIVNVKTDQKVDTGQFKVPKDYPVMTDTQLHKAIRKKMGLDMKHNLLKGLKDQVEGNHE